MSLRPSSRAQEARRRGASQSSLQKQMNNAIIAASENLSKTLETGSSGVGESWQVEVERLFYKVPELRTAARITGRAMSQCRLIVARPSANGEPVPLDIGTKEKPGPDADHPAWKLIQAFAGGMGGQAAMLEQLGVLLTTTGEGILIGKMDQSKISSLDPLEAMQAYSPNQVTARNRTSIVLRTGEGGGTKAEKTLDPEEGWTAIRVWQQDPFKTYLADSAAKASIGLLREIAMYDDRIRATAISRLAGMGLLFVNEDITLPVATSAKDEPQEDGTLDPFMVLMMKVMSMAMENQDSAAARVPILIRAKDPKTAVEHITFDTPFDDKILELREGALKRFAVAVDMPPEELAGMGDVSHWTGALITEDWLKNYLPVLMGLLCGSLTSGWLLQAMAAAGYGDMPNDVIIWYDDSSVRTRENTAAEAAQAYDRGEINGDALRRALGYDDGDAPDFTTMEGKRQLALMLVLKAPALAPALQRYIGLDIDESKLFEGGTTPGGANGQNVALPGQNPKTGRVTAPVETKGPPNVNHTMPNPDDSRAMHTRK